MLQNKIDFTNWHIRWIVYNFYIDFFFRKSYNNEDFKKIAVDYFLQTIGPLNYRSLKLQWLFPHS